MVYYDMIYCVRLSYFKGRTRCKGCDRGSSALVSIRSCALSRFYRFCSYVVTQFLLVSNQQSGDDSLLMSAQPLTTNIKTCCIQPVGS